MNEEAFHVTCAATASRAMPPNRSPALECTERPALTSETPRLHFTVMEMEEGVLSENAPSLCFCPRVAVVAEVSHREGPPLL